MYLVKVLMFCLEVCFSSYFMRMLVSELTWGDRASNGLFKDHFCSTGHAHGMVKVVYAYCKDWS